MGKWLTYFLNIVNTLHGSDPCSRSHHDVFGWMHTRSCYKWKECCWSYCYILKCLSRSISVADWLPYFCLHPMVPSKESSSIVHTQKKCFLPLRWLTLTWVKVILSVCGSIFNSFNTVKLIRTNVTFTSQWASTISSSDWSDLIWLAFALWCLGIQKIYGIWHQSFLWL